MTFKSDRQRRFVMAKLTVSLPESRILTKQAWIQLNPKQKQEQLVRELRLTSESLKRKGFTVEKIDIIKRIQPLKLTRKNEFRLLTDKFNVGGKLTKREHKIIFGK